MNIFEKLLHGLILAGEIAGPIFIHSTRGVAILNASEEFISELPSALAASQQHPQPIPIGGVAK